MVGTQCSPVTIAENVVVDGGELVVIVVNIAALRDNPPLQWTEPAGKLLRFESRRGAGLAPARRTDGHSVIPLRATQTNRP